ncbi:OmpH family outer membrane protein [Candidatus Palibaumannia cicadellinicola]|uniref:Outer membrane protein H n=1 Tax=Candidatus Palibaumannia cicadellinicola TaxID=186490 RepID=A0A0K2BM04_9GAMM|nr:Outer membrane protein H precursor [Candidatus Baumannia cicadellinicola]
MKKWLYAASLIFLFFTYTDTLATDRIAVVNILSILQQSPQFALVAQQLEKEFQNSINELKLIEEDLQNQIQRLQRDGSIMKESERSELEKSVIQQRDTLSNKVKNFEKNQNFRQREERSKILSSIKDIVKNIASKEGYDVVIDTNAVAYASNTKDITADVLKQVL